jgi:hypothetical protein
MLYQIINTNFNNAYGSPSKIQIIYSLYFNGIDLYRTQDQLTVDDRVIFFLNHKKERKKLRNEINIEILFTFKRVSACAQHNCYKIIFLVHMTSTIIMEIVD